MAGSVRVSCGCTMELGLTQLSPPWQAGRPGREYAFYKEASLLTPPRCQRSRLDVSNQLSNVAVGEQAVAKGQAIVILG
jgi:hypothetical protein